MTPSKSHNAPPRAAAAIRNGLTGATAVQPGGVANSMFRLTEAYTPTQLEPLSPAVSLFEVMTKFAEPHTSKPGFYPRLGVVGVVYKRDTLTTPQCPRRPQPRNAREWRCRQAVLHMVRLTGHQYS